MNDRTPLPTTEMGELTLFNVFSILSAFLFYINDCKLRENPPNHQTFLNFFIKAQKRHKIRTLPTGEKYSLDNSNHPSSYLDRSIEITQVFQPRSKDPMFRGQRGGGKASKSRRQSNALPTAKGKRDVGFFEEGLWLWQLWQIGEKESPEPISLKTAICLSMPD